MIILIKKGNLIIIINWHVWFKISTKNLLLKQIYLRTINNYLLILIYMIYLQNIINQTK